MQNGVMLSALSILMALNACGDGTAADNALDAAVADADTDPGLRFVESTPTLLRAPKDDVDPSTPGFQVDVSVEMTGTDYDYAGVTFTLANKQQNTSEFWIGNRASFRLTLAVGRKGSDTINVITATSPRQHHKDASATWAITVRATE